MILKKEFKLTPSTTAGGNWRLFLRVFAKKVLIAGGRLAAACYMPILFRRLHLNQEIHYLLFLAESFQLN